MRPRDSGLGARDQSALGSCLMVDEVFGMDSFFTLASFLGFDSFPTPGSFFSDLSALSVGSYLTFKAFLATGSFFTNSVFLTISVLVVDGCGILSLVARFMGPGPMLRSFNQASVSFMDLAVCLGRFGISCA